MAVQLIEFIYATLYKRVNDPASRFWLPTVLKDVQTDDGRALDPLPVAEWNIGELGGDQGKSIGDNIAAQWWVFVGAAYDDAQDDGATGLPDLALFTSQRDADHPYPTLDLTAVTVEGLRNASVGDLQNPTPTGSGYQGTVRVTTAAYDTHGLRKQITVKGEYSLVQHVVVIDGSVGSELKPPTKVVVEGLTGVEWPRQEIEGHGQFTMTATDLVLDVALRVEAAGSGSGRAAQLTIDSIAVVGQPAFALDEKSLTIEGSTIDENTLDGWKDAAADAFNSPEAAQALTAKLVGTLTDPAFRTQFSGTLTGQLDKAIDGVLGAVQGSLPSADSGFPAKYGPLDVYLFDRLRASVTDTASGFYPPTVVLGASSPTLEPYSLGDIDLGSHNIGVATVDFAFNGGSVKGVSNVQIPVADAGLIDTGIGATLRFGQLPGGGGVPAPPLTLTGTGLISFPGDPDSDLDGDITVTIAHPSAPAKLSFSGRDADELTIALDDLTLSVTPSDLAVTLKLSDPSPFEAAIQKVLNKDEVKQKIIDGVQSTVAAHRTDVAKELTTNARTVIRTKLDG